MSATTETRSPLPSLVEWSAHSPQAKVTLTSHAFAHEGKVILVDPIEGDSTFRKALAALGQPVLIVLTNANHERATLHWKKELNVPVAFSAHASKEISFKPDVILETLKNFQGIQPIPLEGAAPGEHALFIPHLKLLIVGDALINLPETGLSRLPDKYCSEPVKLIKALRSLDKLSFENTAFAHGTTLVRDGKSRLIPLLGAA
jgi:glyoxylase-like metal-dependent hydrolase (beta-lactamase superfamily II)